jgi:hypothetical protein
MTDRHTNPALYYTIKNKLTDPMAMNYAVEYLQAKDYLVSIRHIHDIHLILLEINYLLEKFLEVWLKM